MKRKGRDPRSPEAWQAVLNRIDSMSKEDWEYWIDKLSHAREGVYDPWSEENWPQEKEWLQASNGRAPTPEAESAEVEHAASADRDPGAG